jgi:Protein of unknown function (DUF2877)
MLASVRSPAAMLTAVAVARPVAAALHGPPRPARVVGVYPGAAYLAVGAGLVALTALDAERLPFGVQVPLVSRRERALLGLAVGAVGTVGGGALRLPAPAAGEEACRMAATAVGGEVLRLPPLAVGDGASLFLPQADDGASRFGARAVRIVAPPAAAWDPRPAVAGLDGAPDTVRARVGDLQQRLAAWARADSLAAQLRGSGPARAAAASGIDYQPRLWAGLAAFARAVRRDDAAGTDAAARALIGLGPGLTPAADDVLGGLLAAGRFLARLLGSDVGRWRRAARIVRRAARGQTTAVSEALLGCASVGAVSETLGDLLRALAAPTAAPLEQALTRTLALGHTSGADAALGVLLGARLQLGLLPGVRARRTVSPGAWPGYGELPGVPPRSAGLLGARTRPGVLPGAKSRPAVLPGARLGSGALPGAGPRPAGQGESPRGGREDAW